MIVIPADRFAHIIDAAERAYPEECCGLLVGYCGQTSQLCVTRIVPSANVASGSKRDHFEVDPRIRFALMRELSGSGEAIIGHYHSHPDHPAEPSRRDVDMAWEPELVWLITSVCEGQAVRTAAYRINGATHRYDEITLHIGDLPRLPPNDPRREAP